ncbi:MAG: hypothetical protein LH615_08825 [Ferruginibacter sp.]|nr:hypothetical protein [Ferruginibacter sp.]
MKVSNKAALILLGLGALAVYKYSKMSEDEKIAIKEKGKKIFDEHISPLISSALGLKEETEAVLQENSIK